MKKRIFSVVWKLIKSFLNRVIESHCPICGSFEKQVFLWEDFDRIGYRCRKCGAEYPSLSLYDDIL